jgi:hypothetical protein
MAAPRNSTLRKDFRIFGDLGFLVTLLIIGILAGIGAYVLIKASNTYGIPIGPYWK